jgi:type III restriction enzyme
VIIRRSDLKPFQERAASNLAGMIQSYPGPRFKARYDPDSGELLPFLCRLRAITGSGKTPILALTARHLSRGVVLWTTNRGAVISQTLANLRSGGKYSEILPEGTQVFLLGEMSAADWTQTMSSETGLTILLSTVAAFNQEGDKLKIHQKVGEYTRWEMLGRKGENGRVRPLYVFYDEGHGATEKQFLKLRELDPRSFVLASASPLPEDLSDLLSGKTQEEREQSLAERTEAVPTKEVVEAGLLKNRLYFVDCNAAQADAVREANDKWIELQGKLDEFGKVPIACFIVNETARGVDIWEHLTDIGVNPSKIAVHLSGARDVIVDRRGSLSGLIDTYTGKKLGDRSPEMLASAGYTHLIWNLTLREGWDEPLAYVAYIDEHGRSTIDIVQKIGRFVRQPDASPFSDPDLNSAYFYFNIPDENFTQLIESTQAEMETDGYEVIPVSKNRRPPSSRAVPVQKSKSLPSIAPWFGSSVKDLDDILLEHISYFHEKGMHAEGVIRTRVFEMSTLEEDVSKRLERKSDANETITPWEFISSRLGAIDSRIVNDDGTIFSAELKVHEKMTQPVQYGSDAMMALEKSIPQIREKLNEKFQLATLGKHAVHQLQPFRLVSPDISGGTDSYREKYKVRPFKHSLHREYNGFNPFELRVAEALDALKMPWCRNPVGKDGYRIPIQELGSDTVSFYPDFLLWTDNEVWALDPKGKHLVVAAVAEKLMDLSGLKGLKPTIRVGFILEGNYILDAQNHYKKTGQDGYTLIRKVGTRPKALTFPSLTKLTANLKT